VEGVTGGLPLGLTVLLEGEEECGSPNLAPFLRDNAQSLAPRSRSSATPICGTPKPRRSR